MNAIAPTRPAELQLCRVRLATGAEARSHLRAAIGARDVLADPEAAVLLTSEPGPDVTRPEARETVTFAITCSCGHKRVDVHDRSQLRQGQD